jgi:transposase
VDPYIASVKEHCPNAAIVFDRFHVSKKVNDALDSIRKKEFRKSGGEERKAVKKERFVIPKRKKNLTEDESEALIVLKQKNDALYTAYLLKEQVLDIFCEKNKNTAIKRFEIWFANIQQSGLVQFDRVAKAIKTYFYGISNYFEHRATNGGAEAINNKINVIKRWRMDTRTWCISN